MNFLNKVFNGVKNLFMLINTGNDAIKLLQCRELTEYNILFKNLNAQSKNCKIGVTKYAESFLLTECTQLINPKIKFLDTMTTNEIPVSKQDTTFINFSQKMNKNIQRISRRNKNINDLAQKSILLKRQFEIIKNSALNLNIDLHPLTKECVKIPNQFNGIGYLDSLYEALKEPMEEKLVDKQIEYAEYHYLNTNYAVPQFFQKLDSFLPESKEIVIDAIEEHVKDQFKRRTRTNSKRQIRRTFNNLTNIKKCSEGITLQNKKKPNKLSFNESITDQGLHIAYIYKNKGEDSHPYIKEFVSHLDDTSRPQNISDQAYAKATHKTLKKIITNKTFAKPTIM